MKRELKVKCLILCALTHISLYQSYIVKRIIQLRTTQICGQLPCSVSYIGLCGEAVGYSCYFSHPSAAPSWATVPCEN